MLYRQGSGVALHTAPVARKYGVWKSRGKELCLFLHKSEGRWSLLFISALLILLATVVLCACGQATPPDLLRSGELKQFSLLSGSSQAGGLSLLSYMTNMEGRDLVCTRVEWVVHRVNNMESYVARAQKYTILSGASSTVISNRYLYFETVKGEPVLLQGRVRSILKGSSAYQALIRKRLEELFVKHYGAHAAGRNRFVDEQLRTTWKGEQDSLPSRDLIWKIDRKNWSLSGRIGGSEVTLNGKRPGRLLFPLGLRRLLERRSRAGGGGERIHLLLPWGGELPVSVRLELSGISNGYFSCHAVGQEIGTNILRFGTNILPVSFQRTGWSMRPLPPAESGDMLP